MPFRADPTPRAFLLALLLSPHAAAQVTVHRDLLFATVPGASGPVDLHLDLHLPAGTGPHPVVVWIHGGGWREGSRRDPPAAFLAGRGYAVASIDYRFSWQARWPAQLHDCKGAVRWLRAHAAAHGLDPVRIGAWGESAGGQLAAMLGTTGGPGTVHLAGRAFDLEGATGGNLAHSSRVQAVVDWYGATGLLSMASFPSAIDHDAPDSPASELLGGPIRTLPLDVASAEPATFLSRDDAPMLIEHGTLDAIVPFHQGGLLWAQGTRGCGLDWRFRALAGSGHGGAGFGPLSVLAFLDEQLAAGRPLVSLQAIGPALAEGAPGPGIVRLRRTGDPARELVVHLAAGGSATEGRDFEALGGIVRLGPGQAHTDLSVFARDDALVEGDEAVRVSLCAGPGYAVDPRAACAELLLADDEPGAGLPEVWVLATDGVADEAGDPGRLDVSRTGSTAQALEVRVVASGTATGGLDCDPVPERVVIPAGAASAAVVVRARADGRWESTETVILEVAAGTGYRVGAPAGAHVRIDDVHPGPAPVVAVTVGDPDCRERPARAGTFLLTRTAGVGAPLEVAVAHGGTATAGVDHAALPEIVVFGAADFVARVDVVPLDDVLAEGDETVVLRVLPGAHYRVGYAGEQTLTIADDEARLPAGAELALEVGPLAGGRPLVLTLLDRQPQAPWAVFAALGRSWWELPGGDHPVLLDPAQVGAGPLALGVLGADARAVAAPVLQWPPGLVGAAVHLQAVVLRSAPPVLGVSPCVVRAVRP